MAVFPQDGGEPSLAELGRVWSQENYT